MTAAQRATLELVLAEMSGENVRVYYAGDAADALRAALGTCGNCAHANMDDAPHEPGWCFCAAPGLSAANRARFPFSGRGMPLGERCTGWTAKEGA